MIFSLAIYSPPSSVTSYSAYQFAKALLKQGHSLYRVFFYHDGVHHGSALTCNPQDELDLCSHWQALQKEYQLDIVVCIASSLKRGLINSLEASRYEKTNHNLARGIDLSGLGQWVDAAITSDRTLTFGG